MKYRTGTLTHDVDGVSEKYLVTMPTFVCT
jgi:hypothetical protein